MRCRDCFHAPVTCRDCMVTLHEFNPLHFIEEWSDGFFARTTLGSLGVVINLGHHGQACPSRSPLMQQTSFLSVTHTNGIQSVQVRYCLCPASGDESTQLFRTGLFPASFTSPKSAFSFHSLKDFSRLQAQAKTPAGDYLEVLNQKSSDDLLTGAKVCFLALSLKTLVESRLLRTVSANSMSPTASLSHCGALRDRGSTIPQLSQMAVWLFYAQVAPIRPSICRQNGGLESQHSGRSSLFPF